MKTIFINIAIDQAGAAMGVSHFACMHLGIGHRLPITCQQLNFFHADDPVIGTAMLNKFEILATGMADFLQRFSVSAEAEECA